MTKVEKLLESRGFDLKKLLNDETVYKVSNLYKAAQIIKEAIAAGRHIHVIPDYDCDGIMAGFNIYIELTELGADFTMRFPKRMSEGYGISEKLLSEVPDGSLIITIDNGIAAVEVVELAKERGIDVVVLDHHEIRDDGLIPDAKCVVDPHIIKEEGEFEHYCGAGIGHMLAKELNLSQDTINKTMVLAAFATIQDVVPLVDNNRNIVKNGLKLLNEQKVDLPGIYSLCSALKLIPTTDVNSAINEEDIAFQIGPCINAMGRMVDDGARIAFEYLLHYDIYGEDGIREIVDWNKKRKELTVEQQNKLEITANAVISDNPKTTCMVLCGSGFHEGIIGINAAKVCEKYSMPAIVFTEAENGMYKGSARSVEGVHIKEKLDQISHLIYSYGGHAGAAGITIEPEKLDDFVEAINKIIPKVIVNTNSWKYDIEIAEQEIEEMYHDLKKYAPYGEEFPAPVFRINDYELEKSYGKYYRFIGDEGVAFNGSKAEAVSFNLKEKYKKYGTPLQMNIVGTLGYSRYSKKTQIMLNDFQPIVQTQEGGFLI